MPQPFAETGRKTAGQQMRDQQQPKSDPDLIGVPRTQKACHEKLDLRQQAESNLHGAIVGDILVHTSPVFGQGLHDGCHATSP